MAFTPRINIYDTDQTTITGSTEEAFDVAFIPGFANIALGDNETLSSEVVANRFDNYAQFTSVIGTEPTCVWRYEVDGTQEFSYKKPYDFAVKKLEKQSTTDIDAIKVNQYINEHLLADDAIQIIWVDKSWLYAAELLRAGLPIFYYAIDGHRESDIDDKESYSEANAESDARAKFIGTNFEIFRQIYAEMADRGEYDFKYLTTGGFGLHITDNTSEITIASSDCDVFTYPFYLEGSTVSRSCIEYLADIANYRKDCIVLADSLQSDDDNGLKPTYDITSPIADDNTVYDKFNKLVMSNAFTNFYSGDTYTADDQAKSGRRLANTFPWINEICPTFPASWAAYRVDRNVFTMPGSFGYLLSLAVSLQNYPTASWEAIAGVTRSLIPNFVSLDVDERLSNAVADAYNQRNKTQINAITNIRPYGYCIWGNGTLVNNAYFAKQGDGTDGMVASSFVDIMSMVCNVNKVAYRASKRLMFEKNNDVLWTRFRQNVEPYLDSIVTGGGLRTYELKKVETEKRGHLIAKIILYPVYALDSIDVEIILRDTEAEV